MLRFMEIWQPLAGLALFILGMQYMESSIHRLSGRSFKLFLKKHSSRKLPAIAGGTFISAILQSSSMVNLMTLAFVGAGVLSLTQALSVILGSNLGTTVTGWLIATLGFSFDLLKLAYPLAAAGGLVMVLTSREKKIYTLSRLVLSFGLIFLGLHYIKDGTLDLIRSWDITLLHRYPDISFVLAGFVFTSLIQSSSATTAIVLSALYAGAIPLESALAITLGSETGTATKLLIASAGGTATKKRVAAGSMLFNIIPSIVLFPFLPWIGKALTEAMGISNNLFALTAFQTLYNLFSIILFLPLLNRIAARLNKWFKNEESHTMFLSRQVMADPELGLEAFRKETRHFLFDSIDLMTSAMNEKDSVVNKDRMHPGYRDKTLLRKYEFIKQLHGRMRDYFIQLQTEADSKEISGKLEKLMASARNAMYAAKSMKDIFQDILMLSSSSNNIKYGLYLEGLERNRQLCKKLNDILEHSQSATGEAMSAIYQSVTGEYSETLKKLYRGNMEEKLNDTEISTMINFNRELSTAHKSVFIAVNDWLEWPDAAEGLENLPGFIR